MEPPSKHSIHEVLSSQAFPHNEDSAAISTKWLCNMGRFQGWRIPKGEGVSALKSLRIQQGNSGGWVFTTTPNIQRTPQKMAASNLL
jgi:hypothetical protein